MVNYFQIGHASHVRFTHLQNLLILVQEASQHWILQMSNSCLDIREELIDCVRESECLKNGSTFHECMKRQDLDRDCVVLRQGYGDCRRGWVCLDWLVNVVSFWR
jgi:hypothetical protein